jgi:hypothetical protein
VSVSLRSSFIDWLTMEMMLRSIALKVYAVIRSNTTTRLDANDLRVVSGFTGAFWPILRGSAGLSTPEDDLAVVG